jgi:seryl-tRNA synthetase
MAMNVEAEIRELKRRVGELEGSFGFLTQQVKAVHKDLLAFEEKTEARFKQVTGRFDKVDARFDKVEKEVRDLRKDMPGIVGAAVREGLRERRGKS